MQNCVSGHKILWNFSHCPDPGPRSLSRVSGYRCRRSGEKTQAYVEKVNAGNMAIANIESVPAMNRLDALLSVPGLDAVSIGPHDLSVSLGHPEEYDHPVFEAAVKKIIQAARGKGLAIGIHFSLEPERQIKWVNEGANIIIHSFDIALFTQRLIHDMNIIKKGVGDQVCGSQLGDMII